MTELPQWDYTIIIKKKRGKEKTKHMVARPLYSPSDASSYHSATQPRPPLEQPLEYIDSLSMELLGFTALEATRIHH